MKINKKNIIVILCLYVLCTLTLAGCSAIGTNSISNLDKEFSFIYLGDSQADPATGDYTAWGKLINLAAKDDSLPAFVMIGGDLVNDGSNREEWDNFFNAGGKALKKLILYPAIGNHNSSDLYKTIFELPNNGPEDKKEEFYSFDYGDAHFTVLNSNDMGNANEDDILWLKNDLAGTDKTYKIVMFHHPAYPAVDIPKDIDRAETIQKFFVPILEDAGVDLVLTGHQHVYMRTFPLKGGKIDVNGIVYIAGTSGGKQYVSSSFDYIACKIDNQPVYTIITISSGGIIIETKNSQGVTIDSTRNPIISKEQKDLKVTVSGDVISENKSFTLQELSTLTNSGFNHIYSTINNWPSAKFYAAKGITVRSILEKAGVLDTAQVITFRSPDSYEISFTRKQLLDNPQYYYPNINNGSDIHSERVEPIIAYEYKAGSNSLQDVSADELCLIIGQMNPFEHTNPAFIANVSEIIVSEELPEIWQQATAFPEQGQVAIGEKVKLLHKNFGLVKLHYTLDGTEPTVLSPMYNPSTYQPELNAPIIIDKDTIIKVLATGYGKEDSKIKTFTYKVK
ncbi:MAG: metallophosphoesterase [Clostridia bacterium]